MRVENWPDILDKEITAARLKSFEWGKFDCATFAADVVLAMTGDDYIKPIRGRYKTRRGSLANMKRMGWETLEDGVRGQLGEPCESVYFLQRGDVVVFDGGDGHSVGICLGAQSVGPTDKGLQTVNTSDCLHGWHV